MNLDETLVLRISQEVRAEISSLIILKKEFEAAPREPDDSYGTRARASILHDFYTGIERIFVRVAEELNGGVPRSEQWHRQLLTDMTLDLPGVRPPVISDILAESLVPFLRFRHLFRNLYGFILDPSRIAELEAKLSGVFENFMREINSFLAWMTGT